MGTKLSLTEINKQLEKKDLDPELRKQLQKRKKSLSGKDIKK